MPLNVVALIRAKEGKHEEVRRHLEALVEPTLNEEGCISYDLHISEEDSQLFMFYETWQDRQALEEHLATSHIRRFRKESEGLLAQPTDIRLFRKVT